MNQKSDSQDFISFSPPCIGEEEIAEVIDTLKTGWLTIGPKTRQFEEEFAKIVEAPDAVAINSCTAGLQLALEALEVGPEDEVITTTMTFAATVNVIEHCGARPVLVDVCPDTLNIDPEKVLQAITPRTKVIMPVHYAGHPVDMRAINDIAETHGLAVVEDAAHAFPLRYENEMVGSGKWLTSFSFYVTKNFTTGEGGMLTGPPELLERARLMRLHGMSRNAWSRYTKEGSWWYDITAPGFKCNMTDIQAAIGLHQLKKIEPFQQRRREIWNRYNNAFESSSALELPTIRPGHDHCLHLYVLRLRDGETSTDRNQLIEDLKERGIGTSVHFIPIHLHSHYKNNYGYEPNDFPVAMDSFSRMLSLPLNPSLTNDQADRIIENVLELTAKNTMRKVA